MTYDAASYGYNNYLDGLNRRGITKPRRTVQQVESRYQYIQRLNTTIDEQKKYIEKHEALVNRAREEILKAQEMINSIICGENIPGEDY